MTVTNHVDSLQNRISANWKNDKFYITSNALLTVVSGVVAVVSSAIFSSYLFTGMFFLISCSASFTASYLLSKKNVKAIKPKKLSDNELVLKSFFDLFHKSEFNRDRCTDQEVMVYDIFDAVVRKDLNTIKFLMEELEELDKENYSLIIKKALDIAKKIQDTESISYLKSIVKDVSSQSKLILKPFYYEISEEKQSKSNLWKKVLMGALAVSMIALSVLGYLYYNRPVTSSDAFQNSFASSKINISTQIIGSGEDLILENTVIGKMKRETSISSPADMFIEDKDSSDVKIVRGQEEFLHARLVCSPKMKHHEMKSLKVQNAIDETSKDFILGNGDSLAVVKQLPARCPEYMFTEDKDISDVEIISNQEDFLDVRLVCSPKTKPHEVKSLKVQNVIDEIGKTELEKPVASSQDMFTKDKDISYVKLCRGNLSDQDLSLKIIPKEKILTKTKFSYFEKNPALIRDKDIDLKEIFPSFEEKNVRKGELGVIFYSNTFLIGDDWTCKYKERYTYPDGEKVIPKPSDYHIITNIYPKFIQDQLSLYMPSNLLEYAKEGDRIAFVFEGNPYLLTLSDRRGEFEMAISDATSKEESPLLWKFNPEKKNQIKRYLPPGYDAPFELWSDMLETKELLENLRDSEEAKFIKVNC
jgi:hypothetical protein